jgi:diaminopimelate epimerase
VLNNLSFYKYQGTGNDFVMIDDRSSFFPIGAIDLVQKMCDRRFGIGADGLILIRKHPEADFEMIYFNSDGSKSFCGNGSRCAVQFAYFLGMIGTKCSFLAIDGMHRGEVFPDGLVSISVRDVSEVELNEQFTFINTGSPHFIQYVSQLNTFPVVEEARKIRYNERFQKEGTNVNYVEVNGNSIDVRTYERGVEDETLSCGSGVTACALSFALLHQQKSPVQIQTKGGTLQVIFDQTGASSFRNIHLKGPAVQVFKGEWNG